MEHDEISEPTGGEAPTNDYIGKHLLVGLTYIDVDGTPVMQEEFHGRITYADEDCVRIETATGTTLTFPPHIQEAAPGDYPLRTTGEVVSNPDYIGHWVIQPPNDDRM